MFGTMNLELPTLKEFIWIVIITLFIIFLLGVYLADVRTF